MWLNWLFIASYQNLQDPASHPNLSCTGLIFFGFNSFKQYIQPRLWWFVVSSCKLAAAGSNYYQLPITTTTYSVLYQLQILRSHQPSRLQPHHRPSQQIVNFTAPGPLANIVGERWSCPWDFDSVLRGSGGAVLLQNIWSHFMAKLSHFVSMDLFKTKSIATKQFQQRFPSASKPSSNLNAIVESTVFDLLC
jgi:hypothetical protein